jgi:hypothetical protein
MCSVGPLRFEEVPPEPARFWIRHAPRSWPGPEDWWIDIARAEPAKKELREAQPSLDAKQVFQDVVYVPPVEPGAGLLRQELLQRCSDLGVPALQQVLPGAPIAANAGPLVVDLTESLLRRRLGDLAVPRGAWTIWPLIPGLTDTADLCDEGLERLAKSGAVGVMPVAPTLTPSLRRRLAEFGSSRSYSRIFHTEETSGLAALAHRVAAKGLAIYPPRPPLAHSRRAPNRALAAHFALLAEMWVVSGRPEGRAQVYFRTARRLDAEPLDVGELALRGGLSGITWIDDEGASEIRAISNGRSSRLLQELEDDYLGGDRDARSGDGSQDGVR